MQVGIGLFSVETGGKFFTLAALVDGKYYQVDQAWINYAGNGNSHIAYPKLHAQPIMHKLERFDLLPTE